MKTLLFWIRSVLLLLLCALASAQAIRISIADWLASTGTSEGYKRALRLAPERPELLAKAVMYRIETEEDSPTLDDDLRRAASMDPFNSVLLMTLGLRAEFRGSAAEAENDLVRAAELDHQFKPAWTIVNYYYRSGQKEKGWPFIQRMLALDPLGFDPVPVFELCWLESSDAPRIQSLLPPTGHMPVKYLEFLMQSRRTDAALDLWPQAFSSAVPADATDRRLVTLFAGFLAGEGRVSEAVAVWNQLVERGFLRYGRLDPQKGIFIADSDFKYPPMESAFGWHLEETPGVFSVWSPGSYRVEVSGDEPASFQLLSVLSPVTPDTRYRLRWQSDGSSLSSPKDPGFGFRIVQGPEAAILRCDPLLASAVPHCDFVALPGVGVVRIELIYQRALGTTRISGVLRLSSVRLEQAH